MYFYFKDTTDKIFWKGFGVTVTIMALTALTADYFAAQRGTIYLKGLEAFITQNLTLLNGFEERHHEQYNRVECVDEELLFKFLEGTQPKEVAKLQTVHGVNYRQRILYLINRKIKDQTVVNDTCLGGIVNLLRTEITDGQSGIKLKLFFDNLYFSVIQFHRL